MLFKNSVRTSKTTPHFTITKINWLTLFKFKVRAAWLAPWKHFSRIYEVLAANPVVRVLFVRLNVKVWRHGWVFLETRE
jgi:hypothetical protein